MLIFPILFIIANLMSESKNIIFYNIITFLFYFKLKYALWSLKLLFNYQGECVIRVNKPDTPDIAPFRQAYHKILTVQGSQQGSPIQFNNNCIQIKIKKSYLRDHMHDEQPCFYSEQLHCYNSFFKGDITDLLHLPMATVLLNIQKDLSTII